jgi:RES domain-containing protein
MTDQPSLPPPDRVQEYIKRWRSLDLKDAEDADIDRSLRDLMNGLLVIPKTEKDGPSISTFYRARKKGDESLWRDFQDLLYPPHAPLGRCNAAGDPVLYCSRKDAVALREIRAKIGDEVALVKYMVVTPKPNLKLAVVVGEANPTNIADGVPVFSGRELESYEILRGFIKEEFTKPVCETKDFRYKISASICRTWFDHHVDGWLYPSVQSSNEECIALRASFVDSREVKIVSAELIQVVDVQDGCFHATPLQMCRGLESALEWVPVANPTSRLICNDRHLHSHSFVIP